MGFLYIQTGTSCRFLGVPKFDHKYIGYSDIEIQKIKRIYDWKVTNWMDKEKHVKNYQYNFYRFVTEHDKRRGTNFIETFPELESFYNKCSRITL